MRLVALFVGRSLSSIVKPLEYTFLFSPYNICTLLSVDRFIDACKKCGIKLNKSYLEHLDRMGLFHPVARFRRAMLRYRKLDEYPWYEIEENLIDELDSDWLPLQLPIRITSEAQLGIYTLLCSRGYLYDPAYCEFEPWPKPEENERDNSAIACIYSQFQIPEIKNVLSACSRSIDLSEYENACAEDLEELGRFIKKEVKRGMRWARSWGDMTHRIAFLCQAISDRYYPKTQTDRRRIQIGGSTSAWWYSYSQAWDADEVVDVLGTNSPEIKKYQEFVARSATSIDPLEHWYDLVSYIAVNKKEKLKGDAMYAQHLYAMEHMLRLFYEDLTGEKLPSPRESERWHTDDLYGLGVSSAPLEQLFYVANSFHVNPAPSLILVVEGVGESLNVPRLFSVVTGGSVDVFGIQVETIRGIGQAEGTRADRFSALEKLVDWHHSRNTIVYIMLDEEGYIKTKLVALMKKKSVFTQGRTVTSKDRMTLLSPCIEFATFTNAEIALALTSVSGERLSFTSDEIEHCRNTMNPNSELKALYIRKTEGSYQLPKVKFLNELFNSMISSIREHKIGDDNPLVDVMHNVAKIASGNVLPVSRDHWKSLQKTGYYGTVNEKSDTDG